MIKKYYQADRLRDLRELILRGGRLYGDRTGFRDLDPQGEIHDYSYNQLIKDVDSLGTKLLELGLQGKHFALVGESSYSYVVSYLAVACGLGVIVPLDKEMSNEDLIRLVKKSDSEVILYSDQLAEDIAEIRKECPEVNLCINISMYEKSTDDPGINTLLEEGRRLVDGGDNRYQKLKIDPEAMSVIIFTSGTTGANKGVMLSQKNLMTVLHGAFSMFKFPKVSFSVLPINHSYEFNLHVLGCIYGGMSLGFNDSIKHVGQNLKTFQPEMSLMVPMIVDALYKNIWKNAEKQHLDKHLRYGIRFSNLIRKIGIDKRRYFFKPVHDNLGGKLKLIVCGGAPLRPDLVKGFDDLGITVYNGYGITECAPLLSSNCSIKNIPGSVGFSIPDNQLRIADPDNDGIGEIQAKGDNVMLGYYKDEESTKATFTEDGWFKTGDLGYIDKKGAIFITGREKNLIILANGKNVHPEELEEHILHNLDYVKEVMVYAPISSDEDHPVLITAEAYLDPDYLVEVGIDEAKDRFMKDVNRLNKQLSAYKRVQDVCLRESEFVKTSTKKIKRFN